MTSIFNLVDYRRMKSAKKQIIKYNEVVNDINSALQIIGKHSPSNRNINKICQELKSEVIFYNDMVKKFTDFIDRIKRNSDVN